MLYADQSQKSNIAAHIDVIRLKKKGGGCRAFSEHKGGGCTVNYNLPVYQAISMEIIQGGSTAL